MQPHLLIQALLLALAASAPTPQRTSGLPDLSGLIGSGSGGLSGSPLTGGSSSFPGLGGSSGGSGSRFNLTRLTSLFGANPSSGTGTSIDWSKWRDLIGGGSSPSIPTIPTVPTVPSNPSIPSIPSTGGGLGSGFGGNSANDVTSKKTCTPNILLYARGTTEGGNVGSSVGPSLIREISKLAPGRFLFQGVDYAADIAGITALGRPGGEIAVRQFGEAAALCPNARIFLSGYSQGAMVMHNAVRSTSVDKSKIGVRIPFLTLMKNAAASTWMGLIANL